MPHADKRAAPNRWTEHLVDIGCQMLALALRQSLRNMGVGRSNSHLSPGPPARAKTPTRRAWAGRAIGKPATLWLNCLWWSGQATIVVDNSDQLYYTLYQDIATHNEEA